MNDMKIEHVIERKNKTICLSMIVKDEIAILKRTFDSVWEYIDCWVICDTGSTDGTQKFICDYFEEKGIYGELIEMEWVNFGYNRNELLKNSKNKADYLLLMDADFVFKPKDLEFKSKMKEDSYYIKYEGNLDYQQVLCVRGDYDWVYKGVTHEYIMCKTKKINAVKTDFFTFLHECDGFNRKEKVSRDIKLLKQGLIDEPNNSRYHFYLAQSYMSGKEFGKARYHYTKRIKAGGWDEEVYFSKFQFAISYLEEINKYNVAIILDKFMEAYYYRKERLEALYYAVRLCREKKLYNIGLSIGLPAVNTPYPVDDFLFISINIHRYDFLNELAICAFHCNKYDISYSINKKMLDSVILPEEMKKNVENNMNISKQKQQSFELTKEPLVKERIDKINKRLNNPQFERIVVNSHLLNNSENFEIGVLVKTRGMNLFKIQQIFEKINKLVLEDENNDKHTDIIFVIIEDGVNQDPIHKYFNNLKYSIFRATIKSDLLDNSDDLGMKTMLKIKCKNIYVIDNENDEWDI